MRGSNKKHLLFHGKTFLAFHFLRAKSEGKNRSLANDFVESLQLIEREAEGKKRHIPHLRGDCPRVDGGQALCHNFELGLLACLLFLTYSLVSLGEYIATKKKESEYLITTHHYTKLKPGYLYKVIKRLGNRSRITPLFPHMFRHTFCTRLMDKGIPIEKIAELAGHESLDTTRIYAKVTLADKKEAVGKLKNRRFFSLGKNRERIYNHVIENYDKKEVDIHRAERKDVNLLFKQKISTIIVGPSGIGKTHELRNLKTKNENVIFMSSLQNKTDFKKLIQILDKRKFFINTTDKDKTLKEAMRGSIKAMLDIIPYELLSDHVLIIDDVGMISKQIKKHLIELKSKITLFCSYYQKDDFANEFKIIELMPLKRKEISIILKNRYPDMIEKKHLELLDILYNKTIGFPRRVFETIERYRKSGENILFIKQDKSIEQTQTQSLAFLFLLVFLVFIVFSLKLSTQGIAITAIIYVFLILGRMFFYRYSSRL